MTLTMPWWAALLLGAALAAPAGFLLGRHTLTARLRRREAELSEDCIAVAFLASEAGDHARALEWFRHARGLAPANATLARQEAWCLAELGRVEEALQAYAEAAFHSEDGLADFDAALLLLRQGCEAARVEDRLGKALARTPALALEARTMPEFKRLRGRPVYDALMARAMDRLRSQAPPRGGVRPPP